MRRRLLGVDDARLDGIEIALVEHVLFSRRYVEVYSLALKHVLIFERLAVRVRRFGAALGSISRHADLNDVMGYGEVPEASQVFRRFSSLSSKPNRLPDEKSIQVTAFYRILN